MNLNPFWYKTTNIAVGCLFVVGIVFICRAIWNLSIFLLAHRFTDRRKFNWPCVGMYTLDLIFGGLLLAIPLFIETVPRGVAYVGEDGEVAMHFKHGTVLKQSTYDTLGKRRGYWINCSSARTWVEMSVAPITENPKVRKIIYAVEVTYDEDPTVVSQLIDLAAKLGLQNRFKTLKTDSWQDYLNPDIDGIIRYYLYEFNDKHSRELSMLYNPLDLKQQDEFRVLVSAYLMPKIGPYQVSITRTSFNLPTQ